MIRFRMLCLLVFVTLFSCGKKIAVKEKITFKDKEIQQKKDSTVVSTFNYEELAPLLQKKGTDKIYVVNFWATWCKPCVDELPVFEKLNKQYKDKNVEVLLVSLDFQKEEQLIPFIDKNKIQSEVVLLDDPDQNKWINAIDKTWSGALPATIIYNNEKRAFYEQSFDELSLLKEIEKFIK